MLHLKSYFNFVATGAVRRPFRRPSPRIHRRHQLFRLRSGTRPIRDRRLQRRIAILDRQNSRRCCYRLRDRVLRVRYYIAFPI